MDSLNDQKENAITARGTTQGLTQDSFEIHQGSSDRNTSQTRYFNA